MSTIIALLKQTLEGVVRLFAGPEPQQETGELCNDYEQRLEPSLPTESEPQKA